MDNEHLARHWLRQLVFEMETDPEIALSKPVEEVRAELRAKGIDIDGIVSRVMARLPAEIRSAGQTRRYTVGSISIPTEIWKTPSTWSFEQRQTLSLGEPTVQFRGDKSLLEGYSADELHARLPWASSSWVTLSITREKGKATFAAIIGKESRPTDRRGVVRVVLQCSNGCEVPIVLSAAKPKELREQSGDMELSSIRLWVE